MASLAAINAAKQTEPVRAIDYVGGFLRAKTGKWGDLSRLKEKTGLSQSQLSQMRQGIGNPTLDKIDAIAGAFQMDTAAIFCATKPSQTDAERDMTSPVLPPLEDVGVPPVEGPLVPLPFPQTPAHFMLYSLIGVLTIEQARAVWDPVYKLVAAATRPEEPLKPPRKHGKS